MSALEEQQGMMLHVMSEVVKLRKAIDSLRCAHSAEGKIVAEGSKLPGWHSVQDTEASTMKEDDKGKALGKPALPAEAPSVQVEACNGGCGSAAGAVSGTPNQPWLFTTLDVHICGG